MSTESAIKHAPIRLERGQSVSLDALAAGRPVIMDGQEREARFLATFTRWHARGLAKNDLKALARVFGVMAGRAAAARAAQQREAMAEAIRAGGPSTPVRYWLVMAGGGGMQDTDPVEIQSFQAQGFAPDLRVMADNG